MDKIEPVRRSRNMRAIRSKDMKPEMMVRRLIHGMGYRYRLHSSRLPGKPDLAFSGRKKVIFVHGCFWHQHDNPKCRITRMPKTHIDYWEQKLAHNKERDKATLLQLNKLGWSTLILWECEIEYPGKVAEQVRSFLDGNHCLDSGKHP